jgi:hypothetical protein
MEQVTKGKNIKSSNIAFAPAKVLDNGAKLVYVNYNGGRFTVQTPWMDLPWAMSSFTEDKYPKHSITLSFRGMDERPDLKIFHDAIQEVENRIIQGGVENCASWFKKQKLSSDVVSNLFNPILRVSCDSEGVPNGKYPPTMRVKVPQRDGIWESKIYDKTGNQYRINDSQSGDRMEELLVKGSKMRCIIQCVGLWVASGNYMCQWKVTRAEVDVPESSGNHSFLPDSDDEDTEATGPPSRQQTASSAPRMLDDSEDEVDTSGGAAVDEADEADEDPLPSPPKKKVVAKKKVVKN